MTKKRGSYKRRDPVLLRDIEYDENGKEIKKEEESPLNPKTQRAQDYCANETIALDPGALQVKLP